MAGIAVAAGAFSGQAIRGHKARKLKGQETEALLDAKNRTMAAATREAAEESRRKEFVYSRALAVAAAGGGGVDDPGMVALLADLNAEGEYRVLSRLWTGQNEAEGLIFRADAARREGEAAFEAGLIGGVTSALSSYSAFGGFSKPPAPASSTPVKAPGYGGGV